MERVVPTALDVPTGIVVLPDKVGASSVAPRLLTGMRSLVEGQKVSFDVVKDNRNGKSSAENLQAA